MVSRTVKTQPKTEKQASLMFGSALEALWKRYLSTMVSRTVKTQPKTEKQASLMFGSVLEALWKRYLSTISGSRNQNAVRSKKRQYRKV
jgi:hypothetical protein